MENFKISYETRPDGIRKFPLATGSYIVTGATGTIGGEICKKIASNSRSVVFAGARDLVRFERSGLAVYPNIKPLVLGERELIWQDKFFSAELEINGVVHCEGSYGELGELASLDLDKWIENLSTYLKRTISLINWMGSGSQNSQVASIFLGGGGASEAYSGLSNYNVMKTALVRLIETAALEISASKLVLNVLGPGPTNSQMVNEVLQSKKVIDKRILDASASLDSARKGVSERVFTAIDYLFSENGRKNSGRFFSAEWDDFGNLSSEGSNSYKLRRVIPSS